MTSIPFDVGTFNNYLSQFAGQPMVKLAPSIPATKPPLLPFSQYPPNYQIPHIPFSAAPVNVNGAQWNGTANWNSSVPPVPPPFPGSFQPMQRTQNTQISINGLPTSQMVNNTNHSSLAGNISPLLQTSSPKSTFLPTNLSQWPPLPSFVPTTKNKSPSYLANSAQHVVDEMKSLHGRALSAPPPLEMNNPYHTPARVPNPNPTQTAAAIVSKSVDPYKQFTSQLKMILEKMIPLNFDSSASRIRKMLTTDKQISDVDQFSEAVRLIVDQAVSVTDHADASAMYTNLCKSLSKVEFAPNEDDAKPVVFLNAVVNSCFSHLNVRTSSSNSESDKQEKEDEKESLSTDAHAGSSMSKMIGAVRLLANLYKAKELPKGNIVDCVNRLIRLEDENSIICIHELMRQIGREFDESVKTQKEKQHWWSSLFDTLKFIERRSTASPKIRALIHEILEAKENNWVFPEATDDELIREEVRAIIESLPVNAETKIDERFAVALKRLRALVPRAERRPYLCAEMMESLLKRIHYYHKEILGTGKTVVDTEQFARMQIENEVMTKQKQTFVETKKAQDKTIGNLQEKVHQLEQEIVGLRNELDLKERTIEQQLLNEAQYRSTVQQAFDAKVEEFRKQLTIQLQAYIGGNK